MTFKKEMEYTTKEMVAAGNLMAVIMKRYHRNHKRSKTTNTGNIGVRTTKEKTSKEELTTKPWKASVPTTKERQQDKQ